MEIEAILICITIIEMLTFKELQPHTLDLSTGVLRDPQGQPVNNQSTAPTDPMQGHKDEIAGLFKQEKPPKIDQIHKAITAHPEIPQEQKQPLIEYATSLAPDPLVALGKKKMYSAKDTEQIFKDSGKTEIKQAQPKTLKENIRDFSVATGFSEARIGQSLRNETLKDYPFAPEAKDMLQNETFIKDVSNKTDPVLNIGKENSYGDNPRRTNYGDIVSGKVPDTFGGHQTTQKVGDVLPLGYDILPESISYKETGGKNQIQVKDYSTITLGHEFLHTLVDRYYKDSFPVESFNSLWEQKKKEWGNKPDNPYRRVDGYLENPELYSRANSYSTANERFAYMGSEIGKQGLSAFPEEFKKFYADIFTSNSSDKSTGGSGRTAP